jgi:hypothetical protein
MPTLPRRTPEQQWVSNLLDELGARRSTLDELAWWFADPDPLMRRASRACFFMALGTLLPHSTSITPTEKT